MQLSNAQLDTLKAAILAESDSEFVALRDAGATGAMAEWYNVAITPAQKVWLTAANPADIDEATPWTHFDSIPQAGKRDSYLHAFFRYSRNFTKAKVRNWVTDVWGAATAGSDAESILKAGQRNATRGEIVFGGTTRTTDSVSGLELNVTRMLRSEDIIAALGGSY
jgi:hypothetical protein